MDALERQSDQLGSGNVPGRLLAPLASRTLALPGSAEDKWLLDQRVQESWVRACSVP